MRRRCFCGCHKAPDGVWPADGVATADVIEAAAACPECQNHHCAVFLKPEPENAPKSVWIDPPQPDERWR